MTDEPTEKVDLPALELKPFNGTRIVQAVVRACESCHYGVKEQADLVCRRSPPTQTYIALPVMGPPLVRGGPPQQGMKIQAFSGFPIVRNDQWCGEFMRRGKS